MQFPVLLGSPSYYRVFIRVEATTQWNGSANPEMCVRRKLTENIRLNHDMTMKVWCTPAPPPWGESLLDKTPFANWFASDFYHVVCRPKRTRTLTTLSWLCVRVELLASTPGTHSSVWRWLNMDFASQCNHFLPCTTNDPVLIPLFAAPVLSLRTSKTSAWAANIGMTFPSPDLSQSKSHRCADRDRVCCLRSAKYQVVGVPLLLPPQVCDDAFLSEDGSNIRVHYNLVSLLFHEASDWEERACLTVIMIEMLFISTTVWKSLLSHTYLDALTSNGARSRVTNPVPFVTTGCRSSQNDSSWVQVKELAGQCFGAKWTTHWKALLAIVSEIGTDPKGQQVRDMHVLATLWKEPGSQFFHRGSAGSIKATAVKRRLHTQHFCHGEVYEVMEPRRDFSCRYCGRSLLLHKKPSQGYNKFYTHA